MESKHATTPETLDTRWGEIRNFHNLNFPWVKEHIHW